jgi:phytoene synthase
MQSPSPDVRPAADRATRAGILSRGSRTFFAASLLLPGRLREPITALYAFCRLADDAVDVECGGRAAIDRLGERLDRIYAGRPLPTPVDRGMADIVARFAIPRTLPDALLEGFAWDAEGRRYDDLDALHAYAVRVAGTVGAMMALLMDVRHPTALARACDLGVAMQLTNIARDVGEDARAGRLYLPRQWLHEAGLDADGWLAAPAFDARLASVVARLLAAAAATYRRADAGIALLPRGCRPAIRAARELYAEIGREVERRGHDSVASRAIVPARRKAALLARALAVAHEAPAADGAPLPSAAFLVDAVVALPHRRVASTAWWNLSARLLRVLDLFERLERMEYPERSAAGD